MSFRPETAQSFKSILNNTSKSVNLSSPELALLQSAWPRVLKRAVLLTGQLAASTALDLSICENSGDIESKSLSLAFLDEIQKGNYENRKVSKCVTRFKNYFKNSFKGKKATESSRAKELYLLYRMTEDVEEVGRTVKASFSVEKKELYKKKCLSQMEFLNQFVNGNTMALEGFINKIGMLIELKKERGWGDLVSEEGTEQEPTEVTAENQNEEVKETKETVETEEAAKESSNVTLEDWEESLKTMLTQLFSSILADLRNIFTRLSCVAKQDAERKAKNKKYKPRCTPSRTALAGLLLEQLELTLGDLQPSEESKALTSSNLYKLKETLTNCLNQESKEKRKPKYAKGTQDYYGAQMSLKSKVITDIKHIFRKHGAVELDTPVFELKETLLGKYGEEGGKLIYDLEDQGGELLSLRYDLTVPFARFMGMNKKIQKLKRFHIAKVYRRDQPNMKKGRFREFYQCDFDITGKYDKMLPDAEVITIMAEVLGKFGLSFEIKISHRLLLEGMVETAGIPLSKFKSVCSSVDKLDKESWEKIAQELKIEKGLTTPQIEALSQMVNFKGPMRDTVKQIRESGIFKDCAKANTSLAELELLDEYLELLGSSKSVILDLSMARGLDYYTGPIFEAVLKEGNLRLGSIGGGGRYDGLIGMFSSRPIPSVGMSIGIERLFILLEKKMLKQTRSSETEVLVATIGKGLVKQQLLTVRGLWEKDIAAETLYALNGKIDKQLKYAIESKIPFIVWIGESEAQKGVVKVKDMATRKETEVKEADLNDYLANLLGK